MITVKYPDGRIETRSYVTASGDVPIGSNRPIPDGATLELLSGCIIVTAPPNARDQGAITWPWHKISELNMGPVITEKVPLRETMP